MIQRIAAFALFSLVAVALTVGVAQAQQQPQPPTELDHRIAGLTSEYERSIAQAAATSATRAATLSSENNGLKFQLQQRDARIAELVKLCGEKCTPPKEEKK